MFERVVAELAHAIEHLLAERVTVTPPKDRVEERKKPRGRNIERFPQSAVP